jgi:hypothetical protein
VLSDRYVGLGTLSISVGNYSVDCDPIEPDLGCSVPDSVAAGLVNLMPFTLGEDFNFNATETSGATCAPSDGGCYFAAGAPIELEFCESDGVTPVDVVEVPEPAATEMLTMGLGLIFCCLASARWAKSPTPEPAFI